MAGIVFNTIAVADFLDHLQIKKGALFDALGFDELVGVTEEIHTRVEFLNDGARGLVKGCFASHVVTGRKQGHLLDMTASGACDGVELINIFDLIPEEIDAHGQILFVGRKDLDPVTPHPKHTAVKIHIVALVVNRNQLIKQAFPRQVHARRDVDAHGKIVFRRTQPKDAGHTGHHHHIGS